MSAKIKRLLVWLLISLWIFSLSFHFIVEGFGGVADHFNGRQTTGISHSHDGDLFVLGEPGIRRFAQTVSDVIITSSLSLISEPLAPPFHPPKSL